jgi:hypothetical protein
MNEMDQLQKNLTAIGGWESIKDLGSPLTNPVLGGFMVAAVIMAVGFITFNIYTWRRMNRARALCREDRRQDIEMPSIIKAIQQPPSRSQSSGSNASAPSMHSATNELYPDLNRQ